MEKNANRGSSEDSAPLVLIRAVVRGDVAEAAKLLAQSPELVRQSLAIGASRQGPAGFFFQSVRHYLYAGDTALHAAAMCYSKEIARLLIDNGANVSSRNRRGAQPLHYAADGGPARSARDAEAQAEMIALLIEAGADPNALDKSAVAPLHRAVRQRCLAAVDALLRKGANVRLKNKSGSTPLHLAVQNTGKSGSGSPEAKLCQREIIEVLLQAGASLRDVDGNGRTAKQCAQDWVRSLL